jgi:outer membrane protein OmpA-like peptidoglycan-associated protein
MRKIILLFSILLTTFLSAQDDEPMQAIRCDAVSRQAPIYNIHVDEDNVKWVANQDGLFKVYDLSYSEPVNISSLDQSLISLPGGNANIRWAKDELNEILNGVLSSTNTLTSAAYNAEKDELWLGTTESGVFKLKTEPSLRLIEQINSSNSKMRSDYVNKIYLDTLGREWIATQEGVMVSKKGKWDLLERYFDILSVAVGPSGDWLLMTDYFGKLDRKDTWYPVELPPRSTEGRLTDMVFDKEGRLWVSSDVITSYNPKTEKVNVFGPAQYFTSEFATSMAADKDGGIWVATEDKGLFLIEKGSNLTVTALVDKELSCAGTTEDAILKARVIGGVPPYKYSWSTGSTGESLENLGPGNYELTVTDGRGRKKIAKVDITDPRVTASISIDKTESEEGAKDGAATVAASGGSGIYTYQWDNGETKAQAVALDEGLHQVTVTDKNGCSSVAEINIDQTVLPLSAAIEPTMELDCPGSNNAALAVRIKGGKAPFQYAWSNGATTEQISNLSEGDYSLTITDGVGNTANTTYTITPREGMQLEIRVIASASKGKTDGQAVVQVVSGGNGNYKYEWDSGEKLANAAALAPGEHTVTVTDQKGCATTASVTISEEVLPLVADISPTDVISCNGSSDGAIQATARGGKGPFEFQWDYNNATGAELSNIPAGEYTVTITDALGSQTTGTYSLRQPEPIQGSITVLQPASTGKDDGQAQVAASGGNGDFSFTWDNGEIADVAKRLAPGKHTVTITDRNQCETTAEVEVSENILPLAVTVQQTGQILCQGQATAALRAVVNGGKPPFQIQWNVQGKTGTTLSELAAGNYTVSITDAAGTTTTTSIEVKEPEVLSATAIAVQPASTNNADGQADVEVSGGTPDYIFSWDNGEKRRQATELGPGAHTVEVIDANGCKTTAQITITENILPLTASIREIGQINCFGEKTAVLEARPTGGKSPYTFNWSVGGEQTERITGLGAGLYKLTITDVEGTQTTAETRVNHPQVLSANITDVEPASTDNEDGKARVEVNGGTGTSTFAWDNGETAEQATALAPGMHTVTVTDQNGCTTTAEVEITENILPLTASLEQTGEIKCNGEATAGLILTKSGGKGPFQIQWSDPALEGEEVSGLGGGDYSVTITDAAGNSTTASFNIPQPRAMEAGISRVQSATTDNEDGAAGFNVRGGTGEYTFAWDNGETTQEATRLSPGNHKVTITDEVGCQIVMEIDIIEKILELTAGIEQTADINCFGEETAALKVSRKGGKGPFTYAWSKEGVSGEEVSKLGAGTYAVTITDAKGTTSTASFNVGQPDELKLQLTDVQPASTDNEDGLATAQVSGGSGNYSYAWDNGETTAKAQRLGPGVHTVTVTDANGCKASTEIEITENVLPLTSSIDIQQPIKCYGDADGALSVNIRGGKKPFQYQWNDASLSGQKVNGLQAGTYEVTITDATGQTVTASASLEAPTQLKATAFFLQTARDETSTDGKAEVQIGGGTQPYAISWDNGEKTKTASTLSFGDHVVTVTDGNGCVDTAGVFVEKRKIPELAVEDVEEGQKIRIEALQFQADSTKIQEKYFPVLDELYSFLTENEAVAIEIGGHTNSLPPDWYCDELSTARAKSISDYLVDLGVAKWRVLFKGYGKRFPIASNDTEEGRKQNQRIEITILSLGNK